MVPEATQDTVLNITLCIQTRLRPVPGTPEWTFKRSFVLLLTEDADGHSDLIHQRTCGVHQHYPATKTKPEMSSLSGFARLLLLDLFIRDCSDLSDCGPQGEQSGSVPTLEQRRCLSSHPGAGGELWSRD